MQPLTVIDSSDSSISTPRDEAIEVLTFSDNKKISFLPLKIANEFPNLLVYVASYCSIKVVKRDHFKNLNKLQHIDLEANQIETVFEDTFIGLTYLEHINLSK